MTAPRIFDSAALAQHRARAGRIAGDRFLAHEAKESLDLRIAATNRRFESVLQRRRARRGRDRAGRGCELRSGDQHAGAARGQRSARRARPDPPQAEARRPVPGRAVRRRDAERAARRLRHGRDRDDGRRQSPRRAVRRRARPGWIAAAGRLRASRRRCGTHDGATIATSSRFCATCAPMARPTRSRSAAANPCRARRWPRRPCRPISRLRATFDIVYLTGWAPHESQQKPLKPGSAKMRLADALRKFER